MKSTRLRPGLYRVAHRGFTFLVEDRDHSSAYPWEVSDENAFHDPWRGNFRTKREALQEIEMYL